MHSRKNIWEAIPENSKVKLTQCNLTVVKKEQPTNARHTFVVSRSFGKLATDLKIGNDSIVCSIEQTKQISKSTPKRWKLITQTESVEIPQVETEKVSAELTQTKNGCEFLTVQQRNERKHQKRIKTQQIKNRNEAKKLAQKFVSSAQEKTQEVPVRRIVGNGITKEVTEFSSMAELHKMYGTPRKTVFVKTENGLEKIQKPAKFGTWTDGFGRIQEVIPDNAIIETY